MNWPTSVDELIIEQSRLAAEQRAPWSPPALPPAVGGTFFCSPRNLPSTGARGDRCWAGASVASPHSGVVSVSIVGEAGHAYLPGFLALREGALLEEAVRSLPIRPDILMVNSTGRDHPRRAGLALHLGAVLDLPTIGVTHRPLLAVGAWPALERGATTPLVIEDECVGSWLCVKSGTRPLAVHAAWGTDPETAVAVVLEATSGRIRTPEPIREARRAARTARTRTP